MRKRLLRAQALALLSLGSAAFLNAEPVQVCKQLNARLATVATLNDCVSPVSFCAEGVITGDGLIQGSTFATILGLSESVGLPGTGEPATTLGYVGDRLIETKKGDLNLRFTGVFDTARGEFSELARVVEGGTGIFLNATGTAYVTGYSNALGNAYFGEITGNICHSPGNGAD